MRNHLFAMTVLTLLLSAGPVRAAIHLVDGGTFQDIQDAIDSANDLDEIVLTQNTYVPDADDPQPIVIGGRRITLRSVAPGDEATVDLTRLDGGYQVSSVLLCSAGSNQHTIIEGLTIEHSAGDAGIICSTSAEPLIRKCKILEHLGAGVICVSAGPKVRQCEINSNLDSGVLAALSAYPVLRRCSIGGNAARRGGGVYARGGSLVTLNHCTISGNGALEYGGGVGVLGATANIFNSTIIANAAGDGGGGVSMEYAAGRIEGSIVEQNQAARGGGVFLCSSSPCVVTSSINSNTATVHGGGLYAAAGQSSSGLPGQQEPPGTGFGQPMCPDPGNAFLVKCYVQNNDAEEDGGGIYIIGGGGYAVDHSLVTGNLAGDEGGGMYVFGGIGTISGSTFSENTAGTGGGFLGFGSGPLKIRNSIFWGNTAVTIPQIGGPVLIEFSNIQGSGGGINGNIDAPPRFVNPAGGDFRLLPGSPCIDAGNNALIPIDGCDWDRNGIATEPLLVDLDCNPRIFPFGGFVDMGCYEYAP